MLSEEVTMQKYLSAAVPFTQSGQSTHQAEQKMKCLSMMLFLSSLDENQSRSIRDIDHHNGRGPSQRQPMKMQTFRRCRTAVGSLVIIGLEL